jgi:hypothetical protein
MHPGANRGVRVVAEDGQLGGALRRRVPLQDGDGIAAVLAQPLGDGLAVAEVGAGQSQQCGHELHLLTTGSGCAAQAAEHQRPGEAPKAATNVHVRRRLTRTNRDPKKVIMNTGSTNTMLIA